MMEIFPLFRTLYQESEHMSQLQDEQMIEFTEKLKMLDREGEELVLALIRNYQLEIDQMSYQQLPYDVKLIKNGLKFTFQKFPPRLQIILHSFVELHHKKLLEEKQRNKFFES